MADSLAIKRNLQAIRQRIDAAADRADRNPASVTLVAVTKYVGIDEIRTLQDLGVQHFGENRTDTARTKIEALDGPVQWHMIGNIQRRKAKDVAECFQWADAVDRSALADALENRCSQAGRTLKTLVEVNVSGEASKHGVGPDDAAALLDHVRHSEHLEACGLMTMAPYDAPEPELRGYFRRLKALADVLTVPECSMGMTDDFEIAIEEGSTQVRIGRALFES